MGHSMSAVRALLGLALVCALAVHADPQAVKKNNPDDVCPNCCSNSGTCENGACKCDIGFKGEACELKHCEGLNGLICSGRGTCDNMTHACSCERGFRGVNCMLEGQATCYQYEGKECNAPHGTCEGGDCRCFEGFAGIACERNTSKTCNADKFRDPAISPYKNAGCRMNMSRLLECEGHGKCDDRGEMCECEDKYTGKFCQISGCPNECSNHGICKINATAATCKCDEGWFGDDCSSGCQQACNNHGECLVEEGAFKCKCDAGFGGEACQKVVCDPACPVNARCELSMTGGNGQPVVVTGRFCVCVDGFAGKNCDRPACKTDKECGPGKCKDRECVCDNGYGGSFCERPACSNATGDMANCSKHGTCQSNDACACAPHFFGVACEKAWCSGNPNAPEDCNGNGKCMATPTGGVACKCKDGFRGSLCESKRCPMDCSGKGQCIEGVCKCAGNFSGVGCERPVCPKFNDLECAGDQRGKCNSKGVCECRVGYTGDACQARPCQENCNNQGTCSADGKCQCFCDKQRGCFVGDTCKTQTCPSANGKMCGGQGLCVMNKCVCYKPFSGYTCTVQVCPNTQAPGPNSSLPQCSGHGKCDFDTGICSCDKGFNGAGCISKACDNDCSGHGFCNMTTGYCYCDAGFTGSDCNSLSCPNDCHARGTCDRGKCVCKEGWWRDDCGERTCKDDCSMNGICSDGECRCNPGRSGKACELISVCPNNCTGRGKCVGGKKMGICECKAGWCGADCNTKLCPNDCSGHGQCNNGTCACFLNEKQPDICDPQQPDGKCSKWFQEDCSELTCPNKCSEKGKCDNGTCRCKAPYVGDHCQVYCDPDAHFYCSGLCDKSCKNKTKLDKVGVIECAKICTPKCLEKMYMDQDPPKPLCLQESLKNLKSKKLSRNSAVSESANSMGDSLGLALENKPEPGPEDQLDTAGKSS